MNPPKDVNEAARKQYLAECHILDTEPEEEFDVVVRVAAKQTNCPTVLVSLIDTDRQWFKSRVGLLVCETPIEQSFCAYAILEDHTFVVEDATLDPRFSDNPLVTDAPHIRMYMGAQLLSAEGIAFGTLCAIDYQARKPKPEEIAALESLAQQVSKIIELRKLSIIVNQQKDELRESFKRMDELKLSLGA